MPQPAARPASICAAAVALLAAGAACPAARAAAVTAHWLNPVSGVWNDGANWSSAPYYPSTGQNFGTIYSAVIDAAGAPYTVTLSNLINLEQLTLHAQDATLRMSFGGRMGLYSSSTVSAGLLWLDGGDIFGAGDLHIQSAMNWRRGDVAGAGELVIDAGGALSLTDAATKILDRTLRNHGTTTVTDADLRIDENGHIDNTGTFIANAPGIAGRVEFETFSEGRTFSNSGLFQSQGRTVSFEDGIRFLNSGSVEATSQSLWFTGGIEHSGSMTIAAGSVVQVGDDSTYAVGSSITGAGVYSITGGDHEFHPGMFAATGGLRIYGGSLTLHEAPVGPLTLGGGAVHFNYFVDFGSSLITSTSLFFNSGFGLDAGAPVHISAMAQVDLGAGDRSFSSVDLNGGLAMNGDATIADGLTWRGGSLSGAGVTTVAPGATLTLTGADKTLSRTLIHTGDTLWDGGDLTLDGTTFTNHGVLTSIGDHAVREGPGAGAWTNDGVVQIQSGELGVFAPLQNNGAVQVAEGATLKLGGPVVMGALASITGAGTVDFAGGVHNLGPQLLGTTGMVRVSGGVVNIDPAFTPSSWSFTGGAANVTADAPLTNATLDGGSIGGPGRLEIDSLHWVRGALAAGGDASVTSTGSILMDGPTNSVRTLSRSLVNEGAVTISTGVLNIDGGSLTNDGMLSVAGGAAIRSIGAGGTLINNGQILTTGSGTASIEGSGLTIINKGTIEFAPGSTLRLGGDIAPGDFGSVIGVGSLRFSNGNIFVPTTGLQVTGGLGVDGASVTFESTPTPTVWTFTGGAATFLSAFDAGASLVTNGTALKFQGGLSIAPDATMRIGLGSIDLCGQDTQIGRLFVQGGTLVGAGDLTVSTQLLWTSGSMTGPGRTILADGAIALLGLTQPITLGRELINQTEASLSTTFFRIDGGVLRNQNLIVTSPSSAVLGLGAGGALINEGVLMTSGAGSFQVLNLGGAVEFQNLGRFEVVEGGGARLAGAPSVTNDGVYSIGRSAYIDVEGDFTNAPGAALEFQTGGYKFKDPAGLLTITGNAELAGSLVVTTPKPQFAAWGDRWTILQFASLTGDFDSFDLPETSDETLRWWAAAGAASYEVGVSHIADIDHDDFIGFSDLNRIASNFNTFGAWADGDVDGDGFIGFADLNIVLSLYNTAAPPRSVPAPGAAVVFCLLAASTHRRR